MAFLFGVPLAKAGALGLGTLGFGSLAAGGALSAVDWYTRDRLQKTLGYDPFVDPFVQPTKRARREQNNPDQPGPSSWGRDIWRVVRSKRARPWPVLTRTRTKRRRKSGFGIPSRRYRRQYKGW